MHKEGFGIFEGESMIYVGDMKIAEQRGGVGHLAGRSFLDEKVTLKQQSHFITLVRCGCDTYVFNCFWILII